jgi:hypothetical protein
MSYTRLNRTGFLMFAAILLGAATPLPAALPGSLLRVSKENPGYAHLTVAQSAMMTGGYQGLVQGVSDEQPWGDLLGYLVAQSQWYDLGTACPHDDHDVFLLGNILARVAGEPLAAMFKRRIADPIGMTRWDWGVAGILDDGLPLNNVAGTPSRSPGIQTSAQDFARLGHLFLNDGLWNGKRLLTASFIQQATSTQALASLPHASGADPAAEPPSLQRSEAEAEFRATSGASRMFSPVSELPRRAGFPDPLIMSDGRRVTTGQQWFNERRPELLALFQHFMYGFLPPAPKELTGKIEREDRGAFGGKATLKEVTSHSDRPNCPRFT